MTRRITLFVATLALLVNLQVAPARGSTTTTQGICGCGEFYPSPNDAIQDAGAVFTGEVVSVTDIPAEQADAFRQKRIVFKVINRWKMARGAESVVDTGPLGEGCGLEFRPGEIWVVYMDTSRIVSKCTRTRLLEEAGEDLAQLGPGNPPLSDELVARVKPVESVERLRGINLYGRLGLAALILAACLGGPFVYYRRKWSATPPTRPDDRQPATDH